MARKKEPNVNTEEKELSYAEKLRRMEDDDRALAEQRLNDGPKTGCLGMSTTFLVGAACLMFLLAGIGFIGYGISSILSGAGISEIAIQIGAGAGITAVTVAVWLVFRKHLGK